MIAAAVRFGLVGVVNTLAGLAVIAVLLHAGAGDYAANAASYTVGLCVSFALNRFFTFGVRGSVRAREVARFLTVFALSYAVNLAVLALMRTLGFAGTMAGQGVAMAAYSAAFFLLSRRLVFGAPGAA